MLTSFSKRWTLGLIMLAVVVILWVLSSFLINIIFEENTYRKPFFITYINTAAFMFYLLPTVRNVANNYNSTGNFNVHRELIIEEEGDNEEEVILENSDDLANSSSPLIPKDDNHLIPSNSDMDSTKRLSLPETIKLSAQFCILWFLANLTTNASLAYTSVASQTILSSTSSFFTLFIGALCNVESVNTLKVVGSIISFVGIMFVTDSDSRERHIRVNEHSNGHGNSNSTIKKDPYSILLGNLLALAGALFYGVYSTLLKKKVEDENRINMKIFFGFVGLFTLLFLWPSIIALNYFGYEPFELPTDPQVIIIVLVNCVITFISDFCWAKAMLLTSPLTVTVGLSITIPVAMLGDAIFKHKHMPLLYIIGAIFILGSFFIISKSSEEEHLDRALEQQNSQSIDPA